MSPIRRKIKRAAEPTEAESTDLGPGMRFAIVVLVSGLALGLPAVLGLFLSSILRSHLLSDGPNSENALFIPILILIVFLVGLFLGLYRLRRPATEKEPSPTFDPRSAWLMRSRHHIKRID
jgi:hypothetical protein